MNNTPLKVDNKDKHIGVHITNNVIYLMYMYVQKIDHGKQVLRRLKNVIDLEDMIKIYKTVLQPHIILYHNIGLCT